MMIYFRFILSCLFGIGIIRYFLKEDFIHMNKIYRAGILISYSISCLILSFYSHFNLLFFLNVFYFIFLHCIIVTDVLTCQIPIKYNGFIGLLGIIRNVFYIKYVHLSDLVTECILTIFVLLIVIGLFMRNGLGGGDVKLIAVSILFIGIDAVLKGLWIGSMLFLLIHMDFIIKRKKSIRKPFGPELCFGLLIGTLSFLMPI